MRDKIITGVTVRFLLLDKKGSVSLLNCTVTIGSKRIE